VSQVRSEHVWNLVPDSGLSGLAWTEKTASFHGAGAPFGHVRNLVPDVAEGDSR
jgi:hypothetical protein